jgi:hypothetical protein
MNIFTKYEQIIKSRAGVLYIEGQPGVAKTAIANAIAERNNWKFVDIRLAQVDGAEVGGIPTKVKHGDHEVLHYALPEWAIYANEQPTLIFFDELNRASLETRNAALQILNEHRIGWNFKFNENVYFMAAGNLGEEDGTEVEELDSALRNRLVIMKHTLTFADWKKHFAEENVYAPIVAFLEANPSHTFKMDTHEDKSFATYRSWTNLSAFIKSLDKATPKEILSWVKEVGSSYVGNANMRFVRFLEDSINLSAKDIFLNWGNVKDQINYNDRSRISELLNEIKQYPFEDHPSKQLENIIDFCRGIHKDELVGFSKAVFSCLLEEENINSNATLKRKNNFKVFLKAFPDIHSVLVDVV